jgi:hypothetical protein
VNIVSDHAFGWAVTALTGGLAGTWFIYDSINLIRTHRADRADPIVRDKRFGYVVGIAIGAIGVVGVLRFHGVL